MIFKGSQLRVMSRKIELTDSEGTEVGTVIQRCPHCGYYGTHDFVNAAEGGYEQCRNCHYLESWVR